MTDVPRETLRALLGVYWENLDPYVGVELGGHGEVRTSDLCGPDSESGYDCE